MELLSQSVPGIHFGDSLNESFVEHLLLRLSRFRRVAMSNPFLGYRQQLEDVIYLEGGIAFQNWLTAFEVLLAISGLMVLVSLAIRIRIRDVWLFRITPGGFILPAFIANALLWSLLFILRQFHPFVLFDPLADAQRIVDFVYIEFTRRYGIVGTNMKGAMFFRCVVWYPSASSSLLRARRELSMRSVVWCGGWMLAWTSTLQSLVVTPRPPTTSFDLGHHPATVNTFFISVPILFIASLATLAGICESHWSRVFDMCAYSASCRRIDELINPINVSATWYLTER